MKKFFVLLIFVAFNYSFGQTADSTLYKWIPSLSTGLNISQIAFSNWTKGGENAFTWTITGDFKLVYKTESWKLNNQAKAAYGRTKLGTASFRTNDNEFYLETVLSHIAGWEVDPFFSNTIRTAITQGFDYKKKPATETIDFFDPGYVTQSIGFTFDKAQGIKTRLGLAFQEVFTKHYNQYSDDPETSEVEKFKFETGIESVTDLNLTLAENILLKSKLRLFTRFESMNVVDVRWDNTITAKVNSWLNVNFAFHMIYEEAQSLQAQIKEALQLGIVYTII